MIDCFESRLQHFCIQDVARQNIIRQFFLFTTTKGLGRTSRLSA